MAVKVYIDTTGVIKGLNQWEDRMARTATYGLNVIATEVLRLSQKEVPHDEGLLQNSGTIEQKSALEFLVGYNKRYAARLHEHPEYRFQKGRKGKYLEDPIKKNRQVFLRYFGEKMKEAM